MGVGAIFCSEELIVFSTWGTGYPYSAYLYLSHLESRYSRDNIGHLLIIMSFEQKRARKSIDIREINYMLDK